MSSGGVDEILSFKRNPDEGLLRNAHKCDENSTKKVVAITFVASTGGDGEDQRWYLDSGTSEHMAKDERKCEALEELEKPVVIVTAMRGEELVASQKGTVNVIANEDGWKLNIRILPIAWIVQLRRSVTMAIEQ
ncbi:hypothetical protein quinque_002815 [Culex quinquefasciatus]